MRRALHLLPVCLLLAVVAGAAAAADVATTRPEGAYVPGEPLPVERLPVNGALSQNSITSMLQDRTGLMWFATLGGVNVYDGYTFRAITSDPRDPDSLSGVLVSRLFEDRDGFIWVAGFHGWLDRIDPLTGKVRHFARSLYGRTDQPPGFGPVGIHQSADGLLWIANRAGLHQFDPKADALRMNVDAGEGRKPLLDLRAVAPTGDGRLWLGAVHGLYRYDPRTGASERFAHVADDPTTLPGDVVVSLYTDRDGSLWVGTSTGLAHWNGEGRGFTRYRHDPRDPRSLGGDFVNAILRDRAGNLWIASQAGGGLSLFRDGAFEVFRHSTDDPDSLAADDLWSLLEDRTGLIWIGSAGLGLNQLNPSTNRFRTMRSVPFNRNSLRSSFIWDLAEAPDRTVWLASLGGLESYDPATGRYATYVPHPGEPTRNQLQAVHVDRAGRFWVGSVDGHLYRFDRATGRFTVVPHPDRKGDGFSEDRIWHFAEAADGRIWLSTLDELVALDPATATVVERIGASNRVPFGLNAAIRASLVDKDGVLWLGGGGAGLIRYEAGKGVTATLTHDPADPLTLSDNGVRSLYQSPDGALWVGTQNGLNKLSDADRRAGRNRFTLFTTREGLPDNTVYGILPDRNGTLWLSSNRGLARLDPKAGRVVERYDSGDGLAGDELNGGAELLASDGRYYFGGVDGLSVFRPEALPRNTRVPQVRLGNVEVDGQLMIGAARDGKLELAHDHRTLSLSFSAMDFHQPRKNRFRYRLGGEGGEWIETDRNSVNLARMAPGDYRIEVLGSNNDGVWSTTPARLDIVVQPPPWRTPWAHAAYALAALALLLLYHLAQRRKLAREREFNERIASAHSLAEANHQLALRNAQFDSLTQLPNRASLMDALGRMMRFARANEREIALLLVNLDRFQRINDTLGHSLGDHVLKMTAERLQAALHRDDLLARGGSDEFAIIAVRPEERDREAWLQGLVARVAEAIALPHVHHDPPLVLTASTGVALYSDSDDSAGDLLGYANIAMHAAKRAGGNQVQRYVPGMIESARERLDIEGRMQRALESEEFVAYYQPLVNLRDRRLAGFEALIRWQPPGQKMIFPDQFIPVAEESGLIVDLGNLMIRRACRQLSIWKRDDIRIAVNVSMRHMRSGTLAGTIRAALAEFGVAAGGLKLEITESAMMENVEDTAEQLREIKRLGVFLSVDDFGTGFSSLGHLKLLPVDEMKIDRSFVADVAANKHSQKIVSSIVRLAHELQLQVVAEGVEEESAVTYLRSIDCDLAQGYLFERPQPPEKLEQNGWLDPEFAFPRRLSAVS
jgi:diguanylate cyclase (GGDEF)-like protein